MTTGWTIWVDVIVLGSLFGCAWLLWINRTAPVERVGKGEPMEHEYDGIQELNNPLPAWWTWLFVITIVFALIYLALYPGLGSYQGMLGWTSHGQHQGEVEEAQALYGPLFDKYAATPIATLAQDEDAVETGSRLFLNHCSQCHGSDARGGDGYPNLTDDDWLYGGAPETIVTSITNGRIGNMPGLAAAVGGDEGVANMAQYVISLSGRDHDAAKAQQAASTYTTLCVVCHGADGKGNQAVGAPNLTDDIWLHGGRIDDIEYQIRTGRINQMPAHGNLLSKEKIHLLATYVYSLSH
ncbi:MAG: cytochrome-c oxidase, cbb3-type subunit III [Myxococcota bacterium]|jgi:cytochrome c oxidase cbb3-type subunit 3|nr:cytochrome-c oxidase, cbb3-type subunit III [Myxococcota bacterium]